MYADGAKLWSRCALPRLTGETTTSCYWNRDKIYVFSDQNRSFLRQQPRECF